MAFCIFYCRLVPNNELCVKKMAEKTHGGKTKNREKCAKHCFLKNFSNRKYHRKNTKFYITDCHYLEKKNIQKLK